MTIHWEEFEKYILKRQIQKLHSALLSKNEHSMFGVISLAQWIYLQISELLFKIGVMMNILLQHFSLNLFWMFIYVLSTPFDIKIINQWRNKTKYFIFMMWTSPIQKWTYSGHHNLDHRALVLTELYSILPASGTRWSQISLKILIKLLWNPMSPAEEFFLLFKSLLSCCNSKNAKNASDKQPVLATSASSNEKHREEH